MSEWFPTCMMNQSVVKKKEQEHIKAYMYEGGRGDHAMPRHTVLECRNTGYWLIEKIER